MKTIFKIHWAAFALVLGGCASATSPLTSKPASDITGSQIGALGAGTGLGALAGDAVGGKKGAVIGGALGLAASALTYNAVSDHDAELVAEAEARGARKARVALFEQMWDENARSPSKPMGVSGGADAQVLYPSETVEGLKLASRQASSDEIQDPTR